jgi:hypothetical protein
MTRFWQSRLAWSLIRLSCGSFGKSQVVELGVSSSGLCICLFLYAIFASRLPARNRKQYVMSSTRRKRCYSDKKQWNGLENSEASPDYTHTRRRSALSCRTATFITLAIGECCTQYEAKTPRTRRHPVSAASLLTAAKQHRNQPCARENICEAGVSRMPASQSATHSACSASASSPFIH